MLDSSNTSYKDNKMKTAFLKIILFLIVNNFLVVCSNSKSENQIQKLFPLLLQNQTHTSQTLKPPLYRSFADVVIEAPSSTGEGFKNSNLAINGVRGGGKFGGSTDVYSLGTTPSTGYIVLEWSNRKVTNGVGIDFVVYENPFVYQNSQNEVFMEQVIVEVSIDGINYCGFNPQYTYSNPNVYSKNPNHWVNFAGKSPVLFNEDTNRLAEQELFDLNKAGGDGFDLDNLSSDNTFNIGCSQTLRDNIIANGFIYLRLVNAFTRNDPNTGNPFLKDSSSFDGTPDIDGASARYLQAR